MDSDQGKLFIGGISWETDEDKLNDYFGNYGQVLQTVVMRDKISGRPRGFGFVVFADPSVLDRVLQEKHTIDGRMVEAKRAMSREDQQTSSRAGNANTARNFGGGGNYRTKKIFVGGLPPTLTEEGFRQYFESYGNVTDVVVMYDQATQRPRGFGFVSFDSEEAVDRVLHKTFHDMNGKQVEVKRALPKDANPGGGGRSMVGGGGGAGSGGGYQVGYGASGGNSGSFDGRTESNRYMQSQNAGGGFPAYGSSGYSASGYGYGPANNSMGYGGYGGYGAANPGYGGAAATAYGNPNAPSAGYGSGPPGPARSSWSSQAPSGYGVGGYGNASAWGGSATGGPGSAPTGQSPGGASGYGSQGYGYGGYGGSDGSYANQASYGAVGGRAGSVLNSNASAGGGEMQGGGGAYRGGGGYGDANGASGYGNQGWNDPSPTSGSYGAQANGPHGGPVGYGGGYGGAPTRQAQQQ